MRLSFLVRVTALTSGGTDGIEARSVRKLAASVAASLMHGNNCFNSTA